MAEGFLGNLMSGIFPQNQRDLDEEERRMIEELRAAGAYVPQERPVNYLQYGGCRRRGRNGARHSCRRLRYGRNRLACSRCRTTRRRTRSSRLRSGHHAVGLGN